MMFKNCFHTWLVLLLLLVSCSKQEKKASEVIASAAQLNAPEYTIGLPTGAAAMFVGERLFPKAKKLYLTSDSDAYVAVSSGKIDAYLYDQPCLEHIAKEKPELAILPGKIAEENIVVGISPARSELLPQINAFIDQYRADGTYQAMYERWITGKNPAMPLIEAPVNPALTLRIGTSGEVVPISYIGPDGKLLGFDVEFIQRLGVALNARIEITAMSYDAMIPAAEAGKLDLLIAGLNDTPERRKMLLMSKPYIDSAISALVKRDRLPKAAPALGACETHDVVSLAGKRVGVMTGSVGELYIETKQPDAIIFSFDTFSDAVSALRSGKLEYVLGSYTSMLNYTLHDQALMLLPEKLSTDANAIAVKKGNQQLLEKLNGAIEKFREQGLLQEIEKRWLRSALIPYEVPNLPAHGAEAPLLRVGIAADREPISFLLEGRFAGLDWELIERIAYELGMRIEYRNMKFSGLLAALQAGKVDLVIANLTRTAERAKMVDFTTDYFANPQVLLTRKELHGEEESDWHLLSGKKVGVLVGSIYDQLQKTMLPDTIAEYYNSYPDMVLALQGGKIAGLLVDEPLGRVTVARQKGLRILKKPLGDTAYAFALSKQNAELCAQINRIMQEMKQDGTWEKLEATWFGDDEAAKAPPELFKSGSKGVLRVITEPVMEPFSYVKDGKPTGYDLDMLSRIARKLDLSLEISNADFAALIPALISGKADLAACGISITEERAKNVLFSEANFQGKIVIVASDQLQDDNKPAAMSFKTALGKLKKSFHSTFVLEDRYKLVLKGLGVTILISLCSILLGTLLGLLLCLLRRSPHKIANVPAKVYIRCLQGTPILVVLMLMYYVVFGSFDANAILIAILSFAMNFAAYASEMFRSGIAALEHGQIEAAQALGFNRLQVLRQIILPQAAKHVLPVFKGEVISTVKMTSVVGYIAIQDLTKVSDIIRSRTYEAFFPLIATALIYFTFSGLLIFLLSLLERKVDPALRKRVVKGVEVKV